MSEANLGLDPKTTALVIVDVQNFTIGLNLVPWSGQQVLANNVRLADACRKAGIAVVLVRVGHDSHLMPSLEPVADSRFSAFQFPPGAKEIPDELGPKEGDIIVDKYNWGAFFGTNLDTHLRRRGIRTLIVTGIVTNIGVDTTMRHAHERGYNQVLVSDGCGAISLEEHESTLRFVAPRLARVRTTDEVLAAL